MTKILIHSNHFITSPDNLGSINDQPLTLQSPQVDWQNNEFNITPPAKLKVPEYVRGEVEDIGDDFRYLWKDGYTGNKIIAHIFTDYHYENGTRGDVTLVKGGLKKFWKQELPLIPYFEEDSIGPLTGFSIRIYNNDPLYSEKYGFHICLANLHYRSVLTDFADQSFGNWKVTQSPVNEGYDPAQYGIKQFDTYGSQPYSLWIEWPIGKKYEVGAYVEVSCEI